MTNDHDVIVVGARCAGSPTAMLLARRGYRVLLVDRASFPSDTVSTHLLHPPAVAALRRWGLLDRVLATGCPPIERYSFDFGPVTIAGRPRPAADDGAADAGGSTAYAPRRTVLDKILVDAAAEAGVEVRERFTVDDVIADDAGIVVGIRGRHHDGSPTVDRAPVVVGADGVSSPVARAVGAQEYATKPVLEVAAYSYWRDVPIEGFETAVRPDRGVAAIPTNDDLTLVIAGWPAAEATTYRADVEANYLATVELAPALAERVRAGTRVERFRTGGVRNFFRVPYGPGWVLVGDAGYTKDPITAQGISDAFADAERCAASLDDVFSGRRTFDDAMTAFHAARDEAAMAIYEFTTQLATLEPPPPEVQQLLGAIHGHQPAMDAFASVVAGTLSPAELFDPDRVRHLLEAPAA
ncbi:MAG TPA: NAD(P)/FAD-dependent oxidoreductase [Acidimicrobiales bacterium]|nr:NAD(P)/FAD-dependent oxidoreductase [Acidimicrobiales bacterium]